MWPTNLIQIMELKMIGQQQQKLFDPQQQINCVARRKQLWTYFCTDNGLELNGSIGTGIKRINLSHGAPLRRHFHKVAIETSRKTCLYAPNDTISNQRPALPTRALGKVMRAATSSDQGIDDLLIVRVALPRQTRFNLIAWQIWAGDKKENWAILSHVSGSSEVLFWYFMFSYFVRLNHSLFLEAMISWRQGFKTQILAGLWYKAF